MLIRAAASATHLHHRHYRIRTPKFSSKISSAAIFATYCLLLLSSSSFFCISSFSSSVWWVSVINIINPVEALSTIAPPIFRSTIATTRAPPRAFDRDVLRKDEFGFPQKEGVSLYYPEHGPSSLWTMSSSSYSSFSKMWLPSNTIPSTTLSSVSHSAVHPSSSSVSKILPTSTQPSSLPRRQRSSRGILGFQIHNHDSHEEKSSYPIESSSSSSPPRASQRLMVPNQKQQQQQQHQSQFRSNVDSSSWNVPEPLSLDIQAAYGSLHGQQQQQQQQSLVLSSQDDDTDLETTTTNRGRGNPPSSSSSHHRILSVEEIETLTVVELKVELGLRGLKKTGNKHELQTRLAQWCSIGGDAISPSHPYHHLDAVLPNHHHEPWKRFERELLSWDIESSTLLKSNQNDRQQQQQQQQQQQRANKNKNDNDSSLLRADSLAEWARTVDLQPLLHRRQAIHREKLKGKKNDRDGSHENSHHHSSLPPAEEYRSVLKKMFERSSASKYSNREVQQMYRAAKHADQAGDRGLSKRLLLELKSATPNDARIYRRLSRMEREDGNVNQARTILREGLARDPKNAFLWHGLGQLEASAGDVVAQKQYLRKAIEVDPSLPHSYHALGTLEHTQGQIANAMKTLKSGIEYCPTNHRLHHALGDLYRDAKMLDMASTSYRKALQYGPHVSHGFAYTALAYVAYEQDRSEECRRWLHRSIQVNDGRHANGWVSLAQFEESEGNIDAARAACLAAISQYERGLRKPSRNIQARRQEQNQWVDFKQQQQEDFISSSRNDLMLSVPSYRSGDRFFNVYRNWARLEERYGTIETVEEVYERGIIAFPLEWKLTLDWAQFLAMLDMKDKARKLYAKSCKIADNRHADPYRQFAEFEMVRGNYDEARKILYSGAMKVLDENDFKSARHGMTELWYTWAVCEWHLGNLSHADTLFRRALSLTCSVEEGSKLKSFILYSMARLEYYREEYRRSQHYIGLCLKENLMPGGNSKVWDLWAAVAEQMGNDKLATQCQNHAEQARLQEAESDGDPSGLSRLLAAAGSSKSSPSPDMQQLMRRDPWHQKIFGSSGTQFSSVFERLVLPVNQSLQRQSEVDIHYELSDS